jgi:hypothetical protein
MPRSPVAGTVAAEAAPQGGQRTRQSLGLEPGARGEGGTPPAASFVAPRTVVQTKPLADTAILPQVRRAPTLGVRVAQESTGEPLPLPAQRPQPPAGSEGTAGGVGAGAAAAPAALQLRVQPPAEAVVQRQPLGAPIVSSPDAGETVALQRASDETVPAEQGQEKGVDLDRLARDVYPLVKRLLAVERERRAGRWR